MKNRTKKRPPSDSQRKFADGGAINNADKSERMEDNETLQNEPIDTPNENNLEPAATSPVPSAVPIVAPQEVSTPEPIQETIPEEIKEEVKPIVEEVKEEKEKIEKDAGGSNILSFVVGGIIALAFGVKWGK